MPHRHSLYGSSLGNDDDEEGLGTGYEAELRQKIEDLTVQITGVQIALADFLIRKKNEPPPPEAVFDPGTASYYIPDANDARLMPGGEYSNIPLGGVLTDGVFDGHPDDEPDPLGALPGPPVDPMEDVDTRPPIEDDPPDDNEPF